MRDPFLAFRLFGRALLLATALAATDAMAEDRALLIGVGRFQSPQINPLPGIDLDIDLMRSTATMLGYRPQVLLNEQASLAGIEQALKTWLIDGTGPQDRVLIYFSGHGTQIPDDNGDEDDQADEVLVPYDLLPSQQDGRIELVNGLVDDRLGALIAAIPSREVLVLIDACHSGTATKSVLPARSYGSDVMAVAKLFSYPGMPVARSKGFSNRGIMVESRPNTATGAGPNYVSLTAARDDQRALATPKGSMFTLGLLEAIREAAASGSPLTLNQLRERTDAYIRAKADPGQVFNPVLTGSDVLAGKPLRLISLDNGHGPVWRQAAEIVGNSAPVQVQIGRRAYAIGESVEIAVDAPSGGFLNVVSIDAHDQATVLFPNRYESNNRVEAGRIVLPTTRLPFDLKANDPPGPTLVVAFLSEKAIDLYRQGEVERDGKGIPIGTFATPGPWGLRGIAPVARDSSAQSGVPLRAGMAEVRICPSGGC
ncbi:caspase family protein [Plasticicumulans sp.]|uniref:caspase family protein n=1 Tax=Plasticicumulans sp. TaxID=2307179 RepID=UPI002BC1CADE|nr:caspase family protein [Plasticicumulans sp.]HMW30122.1 caspase family protein [Plasticicumulans sp.]HNG50317.1 caspase family protein [Plasticicumulans sp.]HNI22516.1 caspase family protein [Plasticicumulans sp.]HNM43822.1 caspase family protein [Plasticicumulans sp.]